MDSTEELYISALRWLLQLFVLIYESPKSLLLVLKISLRIRDSSVTKYSCTRHKDMP